MHQKYANDPSTMYKSKSNINNNYNSIDRGYQHQASMRKHHQQQQQQQSKSTNYYNSIQQNPDAFNSGYGVYHYKVENFSSFGTISCNAENQYGQSGPCYYHIMVAGKCKTIYYKTKKFPKYPTRT